MRECWRSTALLGWRPRVTIASGLPETVAWMQAELDKQSAPGDQRSDGR